LSTRFKKNYNYIDFFRYVAAVVRECKEEEMSQVGAKLEREDRK